MFSVQVTQARSPITSARTSEIVKRISAALSKMACHEDRTASQPTRSGQPGWTHFTYSPWAQTASIWPRSSVSKAR